MAIVIKEDGEPIEMPDRLVIPKSSRGGGTIKIWCEICGRVRRVPYTLEHVHDQRSHNTRLPYTNPGSTITLSPDRITYWRDADTVGMSRGADLGLTYLKAGYKHTSRRYILAHPATIYTCQGLRCTKEAFMRVLYGRADINTVLPIPRVNP